MHEPTHRREPAPAREQAAEAPGAAAPFALPAGYRQYYGLDGAATTVVEESEDAAIQEGDAHETSPAPLDGEPRVLVTVDDTGKAPPGFPDKKQLGFTTMPHAKNALAGALGPSLQIVVKKTGESQWSAKLEPGRAPVGSTVKVYVVPEGQHKVGMKSLANYGVVPVYLQMTSEAYNRVHAGEMEHVDDIDYAWQLTFERAYEIAKKAALAEHAGASEAAAYKAAFEAFVALLPPDLAPHLSKPEAMNEQLDQAYVTAAWLTEERDTGGHHTLGFLKPFTYSKKENRLIKVVDHKSGGIGTVDKTKLIHL